MKSVFFLSLFTGGIYLVFRFLKKQSFNRRKHFINSFQIPVAVGKKVNDHYPHLTHEEITEVLKALKVYFHVCNVAGKRFVSMPSQVVDIAWHEFILNTRQYQLFCQKALGRFLHHVPAEAMPTPTTARAGIQRAWRISCQREKIDPLAPYRLPTLFAIDAKLKIPNGFYYSTQCDSAQGGNTYCTTDIGCGGVGCSGIGHSCGSSSGSDSSCGSGCGSGCGGGD